MFANRDCRAAFELIQLDLGAIWSGRLFRLTAIVFIVVLLAQLYMSRSCMNSFNDLAIQAEAAERENWLNQGDRDPHGAAHHGTFLFKKAPPLAMFDPGFFAYLGTTVRIEAHVRHRLSNLPAENDVAIMRNSFFTPAQIVQGLLPILLIFIGFTSISREREQGTLPLLLSCGMGWRTFLVSKFASLAIVAMLLSSPLWGMLLWTTIVNSFEPIDQDTSIRSLLLLAVLSMFLLCWCLLTIAISASMKSSHSSLGVLLVLWCVTTLFCGPLATTCASTLYPLPSQEEVKKWSDRKKFNPESGENIFRKTREDLERKLLAEYKVSSVKELPFKFDGVVMKAAEVQTDQIYEMDAEQLNSLLSRHDRVFAVASAVSPYLAIRNLSAALSATDRQHHEEFSRAAETYRRHLVLVVNEADAQKDSPDALRGRALWQSVDKFEYRCPPLSRMGASLLSSSLILLLWGAASFILFGRSMTQTQFS